jgi:hypothetical protein
MIFITSRPELPIRLSFKNIRGKYQDVALEQIEEPVIEHDISVLLGYELARIREEYNSQALDDLQLPSDWPGKHIIQILVRMAVPLFIFAATVCRFVEDSAWSDPAGLIEKVLNCPTSAGDYELDRLDATYLLILNQLIVESAGFKRNRLVEEFRDVVGPIVLLAEPLSILSLNMLLNIPVSVIVRRLNTLYSVLLVPSKMDSPVRIFHLSFPDFLVDPAKRTTNEFWVDETKYHKRITNRCLELMSSGHLGRNIYNLKMPRKNRIEVDPRTIDTYLPAHVRYACLYWVYRLKQSKARVLDGEEVCFFLRYHFL